MSQLKTSQSLTKRKKGLSLSLEKKQRVKEENEQMTSLFNQSFNRKSWQNTNSSTRKNRIKFAQSYQKHESGSKFKNQKYLKMTDQDIKLGGNKKFASNQKKILALPNTNPFTEYNSRIQLGGNFGPQSVASIPFSLERKVLRESKVVSLTSNINYFQGVNLQRQNSFCYPQISIPHAQPVSSLRMSTAGPLKVLATLEQNKQQQSELGSRASCKEGGEQKQEGMKQSMDKFRLQKLKKVQIDIDQLLAKAAETRAMLLR